MNREGAIDRQIYCTTPALTLASLAPRFLEKYGEYDSEKALQPARSLETVLQAAMLYGLDDTSLPGPLSW